MRIDRLRVGFRVGRGVAVGVSTCRAISIVVVRVALLVWMLVRALRTGVAVVVVFGNVFHLHGHCGWLAAIDVEAFEGVEDLLCRATLRVLLATLVFLVTVLD